MKQINTAEKPQYLDKSSESLENTKNADMPSILDDEWLNLAQDWQSQPFEKTNIQALLKQTQRRTFWAKSLLAFDVIATIVVIIVFIVFLYENDRDIATITYTGFASLFSVVFVYYEIKIRQQTWQHNCESPDNAIINAIAGCKSSIKYVLLLKLSTWFFFPMVNAYLFAMSANSEKPLWPPFIAVNLFITVMWAVSHFFHLKRKKELKKLLAL